MRRLVLIPVMMAAVVSGTAVPMTTAAAQTLSPPTNTIDLTGTLVDVACYTAFGVKATGEDHEQCAIACAQKGGRLALLTVTGAVFMVTGVFTQNNNAKLLQLINEPVVLTGTVGTRPAPVAAPVVASDGRRPTGTEDGVVGKGRIRQGDFRQGDIPSASETTIEVVSIKLAIVGIP
jgi:hypothetical protein